MPLTRPTRTDLLERSSAELSSRLGIGPLLKRSVLSALAAVHAGLTHALYGAIEYHNRQTFLDTAEGDFLERRASIFGVLRKAATYAAGSVNMTGTDPSTIPLGTQLVRGDGWRYETTAVGTIAGGTALVPVRAIDAGVDGNALAATELSITSGLLGVDNLVTVDGNALAGGADREDDEDLRARALQETRSPFKGGQAANYVTWALEVPGVTRAWTTPLANGVGSVGVTFVVDDHPSSIIPDDPKVAEVDAYIQARRPVTASVQVIKPTEQPVPITVSVTPDTAAVRAAVEANLTDLLNREGIPGTTIPRTHFSEAISTADGESDHVLTVPAADVVVAGGSVATLGTVTWV